MKHRTSTFFLLILVYTWNIVLRYPDINGPHDADGFSIMRQASMIYSLGYNPWLLSGLSYFGMYPYSSPFGTQHFIVAFLQITGLNLDFSVFLLGYCYSFIALNSIFLVSNKITGSKMSAVLSVLAFSSSSYFFNYTFWSISTRGPFLCFLPTFLMSLFSLKNNNVFFKLRHFLISLSLFILLLSTHRIYTFMVFSVALPFLVSSMLDWYVKRNKIEKHYSNKLFHLLLFFSIFFILVLTATFSDYFKNRGIPLDRLWIEDNFEIAYIGPILNVIFTYMSSNILSIFVFVGIVKILSNNYIRQDYRTLTFILLFSSPFFINFEYFSPVGLTLLSLLAGIGLKSIFDKIYSGYSDVKAFSFLMVVLIIFLPYTYYVKEMRTNIMAEKYNISTLSGYGIYPESYNQGFWIVEYIPEEKVIITSSGRSDQIFWIAGAHNRVLDYDLIAADPNLGEIIEVQRYGALNTFFHYRGGSLGGYQYGGLVYDWTGIYRGDMPPNLHAEIMLSDPESYYHNIYEPKYAIGDRSHKIGHNGTINNSEYFNQAEENNYCISDNELWKIYFVQEEYS